MASLKGIKDPQPGTELLDDDLPPPLEDIVVPAAPVENPKDKDSGPATPAPIKTLEKEPTTSHGHGSKHSCCGSGILANDRFACGDIKRYPDKEVCPKAVEGLCQGADHSGSEDDDYDDAEDNATDCEDGEEDKIPLELSECLVCNDYAIADLETLLRHMKAVHKLNLQFLQRKYNMDYLSFVRMVNWTRKKKAESIAAKSDNFKNELTEIFTHPTSPSLPPWTDDCWLQPVIPNDAFLTFNFDDLIVPQPNSTEPTSTSSSSVADLEKKIAELQIALELTQENQQTMQGVMSRIIGPEKDRPTSSRGRDKVSESDIAEAEDDYYFESYDDIGIHADMLNDHPRTLAYADAITKNPCDFSQKSVMDLGCGTGILSMFCAKAGATTVHAIDCSNIIYEAMDIIFENDFGKVIQCHKGKIETMGLNIEKVDILVSEFMGYFLIYEGMLNSYLYARDHFLKPGGKMFPSTAKMAIVALSDEKKYNSDIDMWDKVHGFKMNAMKKKALTEPSIQEIKKSAVVSEEVVLKSLNLHTCNLNDSIIVGDYNFKITKDCELTSVGGYFSVGFDDGSTHKEQLPTSPFDPPTHWKQCVFYLPTKISVKKDETVPVKFSCKPHHHNPRWLIVDLTVGKVSSLYEFR